MKWFVGNLIQATTPWVSTGIDKGARWLPEIATQLDASSIGIVCLTAENVDSRWILFESGALAKRLDGRVCTFLLDVKAEQVLPPLDQFQHTMPDEEDVWKLVTTITKTLSEGGTKLPPEADLRQSFEGYYWPELEKAIKAIREQAPPTGPPERKEREMLAELLDLSRQLVRASGVQESLVRQVHQSVVREDSQSIQGLQRLILDRMVKEQPLGSWRGLLDTLSASSPVGEAKAPDVPPRPNLRSGGDDEPKA